MNTQGKDYNCGPVALKNAYVYKYGHFPQTTLNRLSHECNTNDIYGTERWDIAKNSILPLGKPIYDTNKILNLGSFILLYVLEDEWPHYVFVVTKNSTYNVYNYYDPVKDRYSHINLKREDFYNIFLKNNPRFCDLDYPVAWKI